jgi:tRNA pseudouridine38-40 synthase
VRWALKVYYDGRNFFGSQRQPDKRTVEGELLKSLSTFEINVEDFKCACRTDRGVSALGNVFALTTNSKIIPSAINSTLPKDIRLLAAREADDNFNPRYEALGKTYRYFLYDEGYSISKIKKAAKVFKGQHSFHNFAKLEGRNPVRSIKKIEIKKAAGFFIFTISGESFLWQMIRRMVNVLKMVGNELMAPEDINRLLDPEHNNLIYPLPAENLVLWEVDYPFEFEHDDYSVKRLRKDILKRQIEMKRKSLINELMLGEI